MEIDYDTSYQPKESSFFYGNDKCFKGVLLRLKSIDDLNIVLKTYITYKVKLSIFMNKYLIDHFLHFVDHATRFSRL